MCEEEEKCMHLSLGEISPRYMDNKVNKVNDINALG
jgi:hypothetical protein